MIELATDPNASRMSRTAQPNDGKDADFAHRNGRSGHSWPFLSRDANRPLPQAASKSGPRDSCS